MYKKKNVAYVKPQEPSFLTKLKREAGYVAGPDINTKVSRIKYIFIMNVFKGFREGRKCFVEIAPVSVALFGCYAIFTQNGSH